MKKPAIPRTDGKATLAFVEAVRVNLEVITGRRGERTELDALRTLSISATPTQAEVEALRAALVTLLERIEE